MSDFLSRLAARALGTARAVQPRLLSRFEPSAGLVETIEVTSPREPDAAPPSEPARVVPPPASHVSPLEASPPEGRARPGLEPKPPGTVEAEVNPSPPRPPAATPSSTRLVTLEEKRELRETLHRHRTIREEHVFRGEHHVAGPGSAAKPASLEPPAARRAPGRPAPARDLRAEPEPAQTVEVTIGRVEVRAIHQAPPPPREAPVRRGPSLTLDEYLKQRSRGR